MHYRLAFSGLGVGGPIIAPPTPQARKSPATHFQRLQTTGGNVVIKIENVDRNGTKMNKPYSILPDIDP